MLQDLQLFYEQVTQTSSRAWIGKPRNKSGRYISHHDDRCIVKFAGQDGRLASRVLIFLFASTGCPQKCPLSYFVVLHRYLKSLPENFIFLSMKILRQSLHFFAPKYLTVRLLELLKVATAILPLVQIVDIRFKHITERNKIF